MKTATIDTEMSLSIEEIKRFAKRWRDAGPHVVQYWPLWEREAAKFFQCVIVKDDSEVMHGVMTIVCAVCFGQPADIKTALRLVGPASLSIAWMLCRDKPHFSSVIEAEVKFRSSMLAKDWTLQVTKPGQIVVRTVHKTPVETEH